MYIGAELENIYHLSVAEETPSWGHCSRTEYHLMPQSAQISIYCSVGVNKNHMNYDGLTEVTL